VLLYSFLFSTPGRRQRVDKEQRRGFTGLSGIWKPFYWIAFFNLNFYGVSRVQSPDPHSRILCSLHCNIKCSADTVAESILKLLFVAEIRFLIIPTAANSRNRLPVKLRNTYDAQVCRSTCMSCICSWIQSRRCTKSCKKCQDCNATDVHSGCTSW
jgi:hypothetical protein